MDKHLIADNPMSNNGSVAIVRTIQPVSIFQVFEGRSDLTGLKFWKHYTFKNSDGQVEHYTLRMHHYFSTDIDTVDEAEVYKFMDDAWFWYVAYMKWEDKNIDENL